MVVSVGVCGGGGVVSQGGGGARGRQGKEHPKPALPDSAGDRQADSSVLSPMKQMTASLAARLLHLGAKDELVR